MIARLLLFIIVDVILFTGVVYGGRAALRAHPRSRLWLEQRRRKNLGRLNAKKIDHLSFEFCSVCYKHIDPKIDIFKDRNWIHRKCLRQIYSEIQNITNPQLPERKD